MMWLRVMLRRLVNMLRPTTLDRELDEEFRSHIEFATEENLRRGMSFEAARSAAILGFGDVEQIRTDYRQLRGFLPVESAIKELVSAGVELRHSPRSTLLTLSMIACGVGATAAILALVYAFLFKPLPVSHPHQLYLVGDRYNCCVATGFQDDWSLFSYPLYQWLQEHGSQKLQLAAFQAEPDTVSLRAPSGDIFALRSEFVSSNYFEVLGVSAYRGTISMSAIGEKHPSDVGVLSYAAWNKYFHKNPAAIGRDMNVNGRSVKIIGVASKPFFGDRITLSPPELWIPLEAEPSIDSASSKLRRPDVHWLHLIGRLYPRLSASQVSAAMQLQLQEWLRDSTNKASRAGESLIESQELHLIPGDTGVPSIQHEYRSGLLFILCSALVFYVIATANAANMTFTRLARRSYVLARTTNYNLGVKLVRGKDRNESFILSMSGGLIGLWFAFICIHIVLNISFAGLGLPLSLNSDVAAFAILLTAITSAVLLATSFSIDHLPNTARISRHSNRGVTKRTRGVLMATQAGLCLFLICGAKIADDGLTSIMHRDLGFVPSGRYILHIDPRSTAWKTRSPLGVAEIVQHALEYIPGVAKAGYSIYGPMDGINPNLSVFIHGQLPPAFDSSTNTASWNRISNTFFRTMGTQVVAGRTFDSSDNHTTQTVAVVNEAFSRRFFRGQNPLGRCFGTSGSDDKKYRIVGVIQDAQYDRPSAVIPPMFFLSAQQAPPRDARRFNTFVLETARGQSEMTPMIRQAIKNVNPDLLVVDIEPMEQRIRLSLQEKSTVANLISLLGILAIVCAALSIYELTTYIVYEYCESKGTQWRGNCRSLERRIVWSAMAGVLWKVILGVLVMVPLIFGIHGIFATDAQFTAGQGLYAVGQSMALLFVVACAAALISAKQTHHRVSVQQHTES